MEIDVREIEDDDAVDVIRFEDYGMITFNGKAWTIVDDEGDQYLFSVEKEARDEEIDDLIKALHYLKREVN